MNKSSIQNFDCQSESVIEYITSDLAYNSLLEYNKNMNDKYNAIISYLKIMKDLYWTYERSNSLCKMKSVLNDSIMKLEEWDNLMDHIIQYKNYSISKTLTKIYLKKNLEAIKYMKNNVKCSKTDTKIFGTRGVEGCFGVRKINNKNITELDYIRSTNKIRRNLIQNSCVNSKYDSNVKRKYKEMTCSSLMNEDDFVNLIGSNKKQKTHYNHDHQEAKKLKQNFAFQKTQTIRRTFHVPSYSNYSINRNFFFTG
jgi:hypothetical protein